MGASRPLTVISENAMDRSHHGYLVVCYHVSPYCQHINTMFIGHACERFYPSGKPSLSTPCLHCTNSAASAQNLLFLNKKRFNVCTRLWRTILCGTLLKYWLNITRVRTISAPHIRNLGAQVRSAWISTQQSKLNTGSGIRMSILVRID